MNHPTVFGLALLCAAAVSLPAGAKDSVAIGHGCDKHLYQLMMPADSVAATIKTIAVYPVWIEPRLEDSTRLKGIRLIDSLLEASLVASQFGVVPPPVTDSVWEHIKDSVGGLFDPQTGRQDSAKAAAARELLQSSLRDVFHADALLVPQIRIVAAPFDKWTATWDGVDQTYENFGHRFMSGLLHGAYKGRTNALTLTIELDRTGGSGQEIYEGRGGLQVYLLPKNGKFVDLPDSVFFADSARNAKAVRIALCPLISGERR